MFLFLVRESYMYHGKIVTLERDVKTDGKIKTETKSNSPFSFNFLKEVTLTQIILFYRNLQKYFTIYS